MKKSKIQTICEDLAAFGFTSNDHPVTVGDAVTDNTKTFNIHTDGVTVDQIEWLKTRYPNRFTEIFTNFKTLHRPRSIIKLLKIENNKTPITVNVLEYRRQLQQETFDILIQYHTFLMRQPPPSLADITQKMRELSTY